VVVATAVACSTGSGHDTSTSVSPLPPNDKAAIERTFAPQLDRLGVRLTRGALIDVQTGKPSARGTHLAVYVEPTGSYTADDYARRIVGVLRVFVPRAFESWTGLRSLDVCQEPLPSVDPQPEPPPKTKVTLNRDAFRKVRWDNLDLARLLTDATRLGPRALSVYAEAEVQTTGFYEDAAVRAHARTTSPSSPTVSYGR
jgi:hypothetical protein